MDFYYDYTAAVLKDAQAFASCGVSRGEGPVAVTEADVTLAIHAHNQSKFSDPPTQQELQ